MEILCKTNSGEFFNDSLLQHIRARNKDEILSIILEANHSQTADSSGETLLQVAARCGNAWLAQHLIRLGADVDAQNHKKKTPLMLAVKKYQAEVVTVLLEANADIFVPNRSSRCALAIALDNEKISNKRYRYNYDLRMQSKNVLTALLSRVTAESLSNSRHVDSEVFHDNCPLYYFMPLKNVDVIRVLLEKGSAVDAQKPCTFETSLHMAVNQMELETVKLLLEYGANVNIAKVIGDTPITCLFLESGNQGEVLAMCDTLLAAGANMIDRLCRKILVKDLLLRGEKEMIRCVLKYQLDLHFQDRRGHTPLHYLAQNPNPNVFEELRDFDFDVNIRNVGSMRTPLHFAASCRNASSIRSLLDRGADVNATCAKGNTPLGLICTEHFNNTARLEKNIECIEILLCIKKLKA